MATNPKPILLNVGEVRSLLQAGQVTVRRRIRQGPVALKPKERRVGDACWVREPFAAKLDTERFLIKIRYAGDGPNGVARFIPPGKMGATFHTATYRSHPAEYLPKVASRLTVEVMASAVETEGDHQVSVLTLRLQPPDSNRRVQSEECKMQNAKCKMQIEDRKP